MIVFKTFWKVLLKNKVTVIVYTMILLVFGLSNLKTNNQTVDFKASKPDIAIINFDEETEFVKGFSEYLKKNCIVKSFENNSDILNDAIFYRDVNYILYIPKNFTNDFFEGKNPELEVKSTGDYQASYAEMIVSRYMQTANLFQGKINDENELVNKVQEILKNEVNIEMISKIDTSVMQKAATYYSFASYSLIACLVFMIGLIMNSFNEEKIKKRIIISSHNYKKHNRILLLANCCYSIIMWFLYVLISLIVLKDAMFNIRGLLFIINSLIFTICVTTFSVLIANAISNKDALSGISNVVSIGSSFLCGAFVPADWLPNFVVKIAHIIPTYYYINSNDKISVIEEITTKNIQPIIINTVIMLSFSIVFIVLSNVVVRRKRKIA